MHVANFRTPGPMQMDAWQFSLGDGTMLPMLMPGQGMLSLASASPARIKPKAVVETEADLSYLFVQCLNPERGLQAADFARAAAALEIEAAMIRAVSDVESPRGPFDAMGRPEILFERHYFKRLTGGRYDKSDPDLSNPTWGGYGKYSAQYGKLQRAYALDRNAALRSCSWGRFQIMGDNFARAGAATVSAFVVAMTKSEAAHLDAFVAFVRADKKMLGALQKKDWAGFASKYNGPGYKKNDYDTKLAEAYAKWAAIEAAKPAARK